MRPAVYYRVASTEGLHLAPLGRAEGERAGRWRREHASRGITLSQADCLISVGAVGIGAQLATGNPKHFPMPELDVEHWPVDR
jgi:predicted nucleic acid-binding protein